MGPKTFNTGVSVCAIWSIVSRDEQEYNTTGDLSLRYSTLRPPLYFRQSGEHFSLVQLVNLSCPTSNSFDLRRNNDERTSEKMNVLVKLLSLWLLWSRKVFLWWLSRHSFILPSVIFICKKNLLLTKLNFFYFYVFFVTLAIILNSFFICRCSCTQIFLADYTYTSKIFFMVFENFAWCLSLFFIVLLFSCF